MGKRGPKPKGRVLIKWSPNFAYAIGLLATDGCLSKDGRHIDITSKDEEQLKNFLTALNVEFKITVKHSSIGKKYQRVQFGDILFYNFLLSIGFTPAKSKTIRGIKIPEKYFFDFLRGCFDGDGSFYSYYDPRWKSSFMFYTSFVSASKEFIGWLQNEVYRRINIKGHVTKNHHKTMYQLKYAKRESLKIFKKMYYTTTVLCLSRKREKVEKALKEGVMLLK